MKIYIFLKSEIAKYVCSYYKLCCEGLESYQKTRHYAKHLNHLYSSCASFISVYNTALLNSQI